MDATVPGNGAVSMSTESLDRVVGRLEGLETAIAQMQKDLRTLTERMISHVQTPWPTLAAFAAVTISIVALGASGYVREQGRLEGRTETLSAEFVLHIKDGHPSRVSDHAKRNTILLEKMDEDLQREMRDVSAIVEAKVEALKERLQEEMKQLDRIGDLDRDMIHKMLDGLEARQTDYAQRAIQANAQQNTKDAEHERRLAVLEKMEQ